MCTMNESREESDDIISITSDEMAAAAANIELTVKQREEEYVHTYSSRSNNLQLFQRVSVNQVWPQYYIRVKLIIIIFLFKLLYYAIIHARVIQVYNILLFLYFNNTVRHTQTRKI